MLVLQQIEFKAHWFWYKDIQLNTVGSTHTIQAIWQLYKMIKKMYIEQLITLCACGRTTL